MDTMILLLICFVYFVITAILAIIIKLAWWLIMEYTLNLPKRIKDRVLNNPNTLSELIDFIDRYEVTNCPISDIELLIWIKSFETEMGE
jgi:hypothetical protein